MENLVSPSFWSGKRVFLTGHTGFKGSWLAMWLHHLGAKVTGFALPPPTEPSLYEIAAIDESLTSVVGDIRDGEHLRLALAQANPEIVFHLAAQPLVSEGYRSPIDTYMTNVMGTAHLLEAARQQTDLRAVVVITTDKCYENREWQWAYRENDPLGGHDPYSSSKACTEILTSAWRSSYFHDERMPGIATARAGNVIGGGDWAENRLVPDLLAAFATHKIAQIRRPHSIRPWQHVLEPLAGYLQLAEAVFNDKAKAHAWNFGPDPEDTLTVGQIADRCATYWGDKAAWHATESDFPHEAGHLMLDSALAKTHLNWRPRWHIEQALEATVAWQKAWLSQQNMRLFSLQQIKQYSEITP